MSASSVERLGADPYPLSCHVPRSISVTCECLFHGYCSLQLSSQPPSDNGVTVSGVMIVVGFFHLLLSLPEQSYR